MICNFMIFSESVGSGASLSAQSPVNLAIYRTFAFYAFGSPPFFYHHIKNYCKIVTSYDYFCSDFILYVIVR